MIIFINFVVIPFLLFLLSLKTKYINSSILSINSVILLFGAFVGLAYPIRGNNFIEEVSINSSYIYALFYIFFYLGSLFAPNKYVKDSNNESIFLNSNNTFFSFKNNFFYFRYLLIISFFTRIVMLISNTLKYGFSLNMGITFRKEMTYALALDSYKAQSLIYTICSVINQNLFYILLGFTTMLFVLQDSKFNGKKIFFFIMFLNVLIGDYVVGGAYWTFLLLLALVSVLFLLKGRIIINYISKFLKNFKINKNIIKGFSALLVFVNLLVFLISVRTGDNFISVLISIKDIFTYYYAGNLISYSVFQESLRSGENLLYAHNICADLGLSCALVDYLPFKFFIAPIWRIFYLLKDESYISNVWTIKIDNIAPFNTTHFLSFFLSDFGYIGTFIFSLFYGFYVKKLSNNFYRNYDLTNCLQVSFVCFISNFSVRTWFFDSFAFWTTIIFIFFIIPLANKKHAKKNFL